jgi:hypothetical protein
VLSPVPVVVVLVVGGGKAAAEQQGRGLCLSRSVPAAVHPPRGDDPTFVARLTRFRVLWFVQLDLLVEADVEVGQIEYVARSRQCFAVVGYSCLPVSSGTDNLRPFELEYL